jgi:hypothetical protein
MIPKNKQKSAVNRRASQKKSSGLTQIVNTVFPQTFSSNIRFKHKFRFVSAARVNQSITRACLLNLICTGLGTTSIARNLAGIKLNKVELFGSLVNSDADVLALSIEWLSTLGPSSEMSDSGNTFNPAHIVTSPPVNSLAGFWSLTGANETDVIMKINCNTNAIIDIWVEMVLMDDEAISLLTVGGTTTVAGRTYVLPLDNVANATNGQFKPISYETVTVL